MQSCEEGVPGQTKYDMDALLELGSLQLLLAAHSKRKPVGIDTTSKNKKYACESANQVAKKTKAFSEYLNALDKAVTKAETFATKRMHNILIK